MPVLLTIIMHTLYVIQTTACFVFVKWTSVLGVYIALMDLVLIKYVMIMTVPYIQHTCLLRMCLWKVQAVVVPCILVPQFVFLFLTTI